MLRNREIRICLIISAIIIVGGTVAGYIIDRRAGYLVFALTVIITFAWSMGTILRYRKISSLANEIDSILHGKENIDLSHYNEGELSLLQSEITKLFVRLREQADLLENDKARLADSIADISHQVRTPLTSVNLIAAALLNPELDEEQRRAQVRDMQRQLDRIDWLISSLLKIAKLDAGTIFFRHDKILLKSLIDKAAEPLAIPMELKGQKIEADISGSFTGDLSWTAEAVGNILKNCMEHMEQGTIYVTARENSLYSEIIIRDTGPGIDKNDISHLFERFYKGANSSEQSVGIGLALSRMIIVKQNGTVKAENYKSGGAVFTIRFYKGTI